MKKAKKYHGVPRARGIEKEKIINELEDENPYFGFRRIIEGYDEQFHNVMENLPDNFEVNCARIFSNAQYNTNNGIIDGSENAIN